MTLKSRPVVLYDTLWFIILKFVNFKLTSAFNYRIRVRALSIIIFWKWLEIDLSYKKIRLYYKYKIIIQLYFYYFVHLSLRPFFFNHTWMAWNTHNICLLITNISSPHSYGMHKQIYIPENLEHISFTIFNIYLLFEVYENLFGCVCEWSIIIYFPNVIRHYLLGFCGIVNICSAHCEIGKKENQMNLLHVFFFAIIFFSVLFFIMEI